MNPKNNPTNKTPPFDKNIAIQAAIKDYLSNNRRFKKIDTSEKRQQLFDRAKLFASNNVFSYARRLFQLLYNSGERRLDLIEHLAVCTYKDTDLASDFKYKEATTLLLNYLKDNEQNVEIGHANIYGILGSIFKKRWQYENHNKHLHQSLIYYNKGYRLAYDARNDTNLAVLGKAISYLGFCGINIAFVYDQLAKLNSLEDDSADNSVSEACLLKANNLRSEVIKIYHQYEIPFEESWSDPNSTDEYGFEKINKYWFYVTLGEAYLGRKEDFAASKKYYNLSLTHGKIDLWARQSATIQGLNLLQLHHKKDKTALNKGEDILKILLENDSSAPLHSEKIGLALSGGGFRASLFHIGVLSQLAEAGILHKVEVISCVSGGSIIGAYYYLKLKELLEKEGKTKLDKEDYINLVDSIHTDFLKNINENIRLRILENPFINIKMAIKGSFTRTSVTANLYDKYLYNGLFNDKVDLKMRDLKIKPKDPKATEEENKENESFNPVFDNWKRVYKVPELILNATTLNTGHSWQFTATWMGESPANINSEFDALPTLRRVYYTKEEAGEYKDIALSTAVAASAGVPGVFAPVELKNLYKGHAKVLLVDGGVHDNQGVTSLYERECNLLIISDASGQMPELGEPKDSILEVYNRTTSILQDRIRQVQFRDLESRKSAGVIRDYLLVHFTKDLKGGTVDYENCKENLLLPKFEMEDRKNGQTNYGVNTILQKALARIRTDLDAFHNSEAYGLMYSGYKMMEKEIQEATEEEFQNQTKKDTTLKDWRFLPFKNYQEKDSVAMRKMETILKPSSKLIGKLFLFSIFGKCVKWVVVLILIVLFLLFVIEPICREWLFSPYFIGIIVLISVDFLLRKFKMRGFLLPIFLFMIGLIASPIFWTWRIFTKLYVREGKLPKL